MVTTNPLLDKIRNSAATPAEPTPVIITPTPVPELAAAKGEVLFDLLSNQMPVRTALSGGQEVSFPYVTSDPAEIKFLRAFAKHCGLLIVVEGK